MKSSRASRPTWTSGSHNRSRPSRSRAGFLRNVRLRPSWGYTWVRSNAGDAKALSRPAARQSRFGIPPGTWCPSASSWPIPTGRYRGTSLARPPRGSAMPFENYLLVNEPGDDGSTKTVAVPRNMAGLIEHAKFMTGGWPRRVGTALFVPGSDGAISWLPKPAATIGWLDSGVRRVRWRQGVGYATQEQFHAELQRQAQGYDSVERIFHVPAMPGVYYTCSTPEAGDGSALAELLARFSPQTPLDGELILAWLATAIWGGECGLRPMFAITGDGRGCGKTTLAEVYGLLFGGTIDFSRGEDIEAHQGPIAISRRTRVSRLPAGQREIIQTELGRD